MRSDRTRSTVGKWNNSGILIFVNRGIAPQIELAANDAVTPEGIDCWVTLRTMT